MFVFLSKTDTGGTLGRAFLERRALRQYPLYRSHLSLIPLGAYSLKVDLCQCQCLRILTPTGPETRLSGFQ